MSAKTWKIGVADEPWKVAICERDIEAARQLIVQLCYIIGDEAVISAMSGAEILKALRDYAKSSALSMSAEMPPETATGTKKAFLREVLG